MSRQKIVVVGNGMVGHHFVETLANNGADVDITVLGDKSKLRHVFKGGQAIDLTPGPTRQPISGWRVSSFADCILTQDVAHGGKDDA